MEIAALCTMTLHVVLLTIRDDQELVGLRTNIVDLLAMPCTEDVELELPGVQGLDHLPDLSD